MRKPILIIAACVSLTTYDTAFSLPKRTVAQITTLTSDYLSTHQNVTRTFRSGTQGITVVTDGTDTDMYSDYGEYDEELGARFIRKDGTTYFQFSPGQEVAPGKFFEKLPDHHEPEQLSILGVMVTALTNIADSHREYELFAATGILTSTTTEDGLVHYVIDIDMTEAVRRVNLDAFTALRSVMELTSQTVYYEYKKVRAGDAEAQARLRTQILKEFGPHATFELWVNREGRPDRYVLTAKKRTEMVFSDWGTSTVDAPPADQVKLWEGWR